MKKAIVTGSSGFIGSHLVDELRGRHIEVVPFDLTTGQNVLNQTQLIGFGEDCDVIFHLAGEPSSSQWDRNPSLNFSREIIGLLNVAKAGPRVVYASSGYVYGEPQESPIPETHWRNPRSFYGLGKLAAELIAERQGHIVRARLFNVYGPGQRSGFVIPDLIAAAKSGVVSLRNAFVTRDFVWVDDVVDALILLAEKGELGNAYNVGTGLATTIAELVERIAELTGAVISAIHPSDTLDFDLGKLKGGMPYVANISRLKALGWKQLIPLGEGLKRLLLE